MVRKVPGTKRERTHREFGEGRINAGKFRTICSIHNEMLLRLKELEDSEQKEELIRLLEEAFDCGIRMNNKLVEYAQQFGKHGAAEWKDQVFKKIRTPKSKKKG